MYVQLMAEGKLKHNKFKNYLDFIILCNYVEVNLV